MSNLRRRCLQPVVLALSLLAVCGSTNAADNIVDIADNAGTFKTLLAAAKAAGLVHTLQEDGPFTVFAPTDDAFAKLPADTLSGLLKPENKEKLATILKYHVIPGKVASKDVVTRKFAKTLLGDRISFSVRDGRLTVGNAKIIVNDLEASNGIVHVVDEVLLPRQRDIVATAEAMGGFNTFLVAVEAAGLTETLRGEGPFTVLAPSDEAFEKLPEGTLDSLLKPENNPRLRAVLRYHMLPERLSSRQLERVKSTRSIDGDVLEVSSTHPLTLNKSWVLKADFGASNGVVHVMQRVLMPPARAAHNMVNVADKTGRDSDDPFAPHRPAGNIVNVAEEAGTFKTLLAAAKAAGLVDALQGDGPLTVFAPTDDAFAKLPKQTLNDLLKPENKEKLATILKHHVIPGKVAAKDAVQVESAETLSGDSVSISIRDGRLTVNNTNVIVNDVDATNGIIHVIDSVLMPPEDRTIVGVASRAGKFKTLLAAAEAVGLLDELKDKSLSGLGITVFAPTDEAFAKLPEHTLDDLLKPQNKDKLAAILKYHVLFRPLTSAYIRRPKQASEPTVLPGARVRFGRTEHDTARVNEVNIVGEDIRCDNGIIQVIDTVLMPPEDRTIVGGADQYGIFKTLLAAAKAAGLLETLRGEGPFTLFAPTDAAFAKLPEHTLTDLLNPRNKEKLAAILKYHVVNERLTVGRIRSRTATATTLQGATVVARKGARVNRSKGALVNDANIIVGDFPCSNGNIIAIDRVLMPPREDRSIVGVATKAGSFKTLLAAAKAAGLVETLESEGPFTLLAPSDEAFGKLPHGTVEALLKPENQEQLAAILKYHVIPRRRTADELLHWGSAKSLQGTLIQIGSDAPLTLNRSKVVMPDINCSNGVIHVVDKVLMPSDAPKGSFDQDSEFRLLQRLDPALKSHLKSMGGGNKTSVVFSNLSSKPIQVYWIAFDGQPKKWREPIEPGSLDVCERSFEQHVWLIADEHDKGLGLYILDKQNGVVIHK